MPAPAPVYVDLDPADDDGDGDLQVMQSQMIGMQSSLDRILNAIQAQTQATAAIVQQAVYATDGGGGGPPPGPPSARNGADMYGSPGQSGEGTPARPRGFPPLPGFAPPVRLLRRVS